MLAEIISVGTEIILGDIVDTNTAYLAKEMSKLGIDVFYKSTVGDNQKRLEKTLQNAFERSDLIILTGGLGPTEDDLTKQALCSCFNIPLLENATEVERLKNFFAARGRTDMSQNNLRQALIPQGATILENKIGTASGLLVEHKNKYFILLPGPPSEMKHIFTNKVSPWLKNNFLTDEKYIQSHTLKFIGISESLLETKLFELLHYQNNPTLALLAKNGEIHCRLTAKVNNQKEFEDLVNPVKEKILKEVGDYYFGADDLSIEEVVGNELRKNNLRIVTAESCTGGLIAKRLTDIPGSSSFFLGGVVAYDNQVKTSVLNVADQTLLNHGAVSEETALDMAKGVKKLLKGDLAVATTGIAGPGGGSADKPVGLVYISVIGENINICERFIFTGNRQDIRWRAVTRALNLVRRGLKGLE